MTAKMEKTPGVAGLEKLVTDVTRFLTVPGSAVLLGEMISTLNRDLDGQAIKGMELLVRVVLAARYQHQGGCHIVTCGSPPSDPCALSVTLTDLAYWEATL